MFDLSISPCPVLSSVPVNASALLSVPQHLTDGDPRLKICLSPKKICLSPEIQLMNNTNNRSCRTTELHIPKQVLAHCEECKVGKPQLNFKEKPHLDINTSLYTNLVKGKCLQAITEKNIQK